METIEARIKKTKEALFKLQKEIKGASGNAILTDSNEGSKLAIEKCIEMLNYLEGNIQEFNIPFDNFPDEEEENEDDDTGEED